jgi:hypothetical protein
MPHRDGAPSDLDKGSIQASQTKRLLIRFGIFLGIFAAIVPFALGIERRILLVFAPIFCGGSGAEVGPPPGWSGTLSFECLDGSGAADGTNLFNLVFTVAWVVLAVALSALTLVLWLPIEPLLERHGSSFPLHESFTTSPDTLSVADPAADVADQLERLARLHAEGALSDDQYEASKNAVIYDR